MSISSNVRKDSTFRSRRALRRERPGDATVAVGELVQVVLVRLGAQGSWNYGGCGPMPREDDPGRTLRVARFY